MLREDQLAIAPSSSVGDEWLQRPMYVLGRFRRLTPDYAGGYPLGDVDLKIGRRPQNYFGRKTEERMTDSELLLKGERPSMLRPPRGTAPSALRSDADSLRAGGSATSFQMENHEGRHPYSSRLRPPRGHAELRLKGQASTSLQGRNNSDEEYGQGLRPVPSSARIPGRFRDGSSLTVNDGDPRLIPVTLRLATADLDPTLTISSTEYKMNGYSPMLTSPNANAQGKQTSQRQYLNTFKSRSSLNPSELQNMQMMSDMHIAHAPCPLCGSTFGNITIQALEVWAHGSMSYEQEPGFSSFEMLRSSLEK